MLHALAIAGKSAVYYCRIVLRREMHLNRSRLWQTFAVADGRYAIFRESARLRQQGEPVVLVVGFRLRLLRAGRLPHWCFQRLCVLTTPFWSGMPGFRIKLWMVDRQTKDYLGIYDWRGVRQAQQYLDYLLPILRFFSVGGSVWYEKRTGEDLDEYLARHIMLGGGLPAGRFRAGGSSGNGYVAGVGSQSSSSSV